jgi:hypothetical protein
MSATNDVARTRPRWTFTRHYLEMVGAMLLGMATLYPLTQLLVGEGPGTAWLRRPDFDALVMATAMTVPMAVWMRLRRHSRLHVVEMSTAMYAGFVVLFPALWWGGLSEMGLMMGGHVLMPLFMLGAMLARRRDYADAA